MSAPAWTEGLRSEHRKITEGIAIGVRFETVAVVKVSTHYANNSEVIKMATDDARVKLDDKLYGESRYYLNELQTMLALECRGNPAADPKLCCLSKAIEALKPRGL